jgi:hypothetical protein
VSYAILSSILPLLFIEFKKLKISGARVESLASYFGFDKAFALDSDGRSGGLGIFGTMK